MEVYIDGNSDRDINCRTLVSSKIVIFLSHIIKSSIRINIIVKNGNKSDLETQWTDSENISRVLISEVPAAILACSRPVSWTPGGAIIHSGLCAVLRAMVKHQHLVKTGSDVIGLLGYKENCLKACAEVSALTKFCEVDMPVAIATATEHCHGNNTEDGENENHEKHDTGDSVLVEIQKLEHHFNQPPIVPNISKKLKQMTKIKVTPENKTLVNGIVDLKLDGSMIEHTYVEGMDLTMADYMLFVCVHLYMESLADPSHLTRSIPLIVAWYKRMLAMETTKMAAKQCGLHLLDFKLSDRPCAVNGPLKNEIVGAIDSKGIRGAIKQGSKAKQVGVSAILDTLKVSGIEPVYTGPGSLINIDWSNIHPAAHPKQGDLPAKRLDRKCQQLENLASAVMSLAKPGHVIVDFCSGGGHLGILLAYLLPQCQVILVENKEESIVKGYGRIQQLQLTNITIYQCNLDYFRGDFDIGVSLHACGVVTDMVLARCLSKMAAFVISPCCYGAIQDTPSISWPRSHIFEKAKMTSSAMIQLGHAADQTQRAIPLVEQGNLCMGLVDMDRVNLAREHGYTVTLSKLQPPTCTPKNNLIIGTPP